MNNIGISKIKSRIADLMADAEKLGMITLCEDEAKAIFGRLLLLENAMDGVTDDALIGGWAARGLSDYAKSLQDKISAAPAIPAGYRLQPLSEYDAMCEFIRAQPVIPDAIDMSIDDWDSAFEHGKAVGWNACRAEVIRLNANSPAIPDSSDDTKRLDWLDSKNQHLNKISGSTYGWRFEMNHNRCALTDHHHPVKSVRQAIDEAMLAAAPAQENDNIA